MNSKIVEIERHPNLISGYYVAGVPDPPDHLRPVMYEGTLVAVPETSELFRELRHCHHIRGLVYGTIWSY